MRHIQFEDSQSYKVAVLTKPAVFNMQGLTDNYIAPVNLMGVPSSEIIAFTLDQEPNTKKTSAKYSKDYLSKLLPALQSLGVRLLYVADSSYFKILAGQTKADPHFGYAMPCKIKGFEHMTVVLGLNYGALIFNPDLQAKLDMSLNTLASCFTGNYVPPGDGIIHSAQYPQSLEAIAAALESLHQHPRLSCDIEAFSLRFNEAGIGTIAFAWDEHNGIAFPCDYKEIWDKTGTYDRDCEIDVAAYTGFQKENPEVRALIKNFFETYKGELTFHKADYDVVVLIYTLWMKNGLDTAGLLEGLEVMTRSIQDTKIIAYLATNSTAGNILGLKALAHEFAGNWAVEEIKDIRKIPLAKLLQYNLVDALSTCYVRDKYTPIMVADQQEDIYKTLMLPSLKLIIQISLTGMPLDPKRVAEARAKLEAIRDGHLDTIHNSSLVKMLNLVLQNDAMVAANAKLKIKQHPLEKFDGTRLNPNSGPQLRKLLYEQMGLPVIDLTDTKLPATGADTLEKLINHTQEQAYKDLLTALIGYGKADKILSTFIPAFEQAIDKGDGGIWLHGNFNLGGTVSGRLSSSDPNLQNIPANSVYAKLIKECFVAPYGWLFCGADFNSLEDMISALTTKDPNKLKVYTDGFDGHCLRAFSYFPEQCVGIVDTVESINSIKKLYPEQRQDSKVPTFALTYQGTWHTLVANLGLEEEKAKTIEANYHELYKVSDQYLATRLDQASKDGYVTVAFGLRVRTPLLGQVVWGSSRVPYEAQAEGRTAGNAMGQSYGLLNNRAAVAFFEKVWASPYRLDIKPVGLIHDAIYILIRDAVAVVDWANRELIKAMQWQELPEIQHPTVKLGAALDVFWPSWANATTLPNGASWEEILRLARQTKDDHAEKLKAA